MAALTMVKGVPFMHTRDTGTEIYNTLWPAFDEFTATVKLMTGVLATLEVKEEVMAIRSGQGFTAATELTDLIVRERGLSFRTAHHIVTSVVTTMMAEDKGPEAITTAMLDEAALAVTGSALNLDESDVRSALDPRENVEARSVLGGPAPVRVTEAIERLSAGLAGQQSSLDALFQQQVESQTKLADAVNGLR
jgi:argininosuccinate lyase